MLGTPDLGLFAVTLLVVNATPGVDLMFTLVATLKGGVRAGLAAAAAGIGAGCVVHTLVAAFSLAALLATSSAAFNAVKWAGAAYLLWLAAGLLRQGLRGSGAAGFEAPATAAPTRDAWTLFRWGFLTNVLNPKVALFFLALLPQFIAGDAPNEALAFLLLGAWFVVQGFAFLAGFALLVAPLRRWQPGPAIARGLHFAGGGLFALLAARVALTSRP